MKVIILIPVIVMWILALWATIKLSNQNRFGWAKLMVIIWAFLTVLIIMPFL